MTGVWWVGGSSGAGKSTVAGVLSREYGLDVYSTDASIPGHGADGGADAPLLERFRAANMDERWLRDEPAAMAASFPWYAGERFERIVADLAAVHGPTVAEGFRLLPRLVRPLLGSPREAVWLVATAEFRRAAFARRAAEQQFWRRTSDPAGALERLLERDAIFADAVRREAVASGLRVVVVDGSRSARELAGEVARWFQLG